MRDFVEQVLMASSIFSPPVRSLLDVDFYKFTMGQLIHKHFRSTVVTFKLIVRDPDIPVSQMIKESDLRDMLEHAMGLRFTRTDLSWIRGMDVYGKNMFSEEYLEFLRNLKLPPYTLTKVGDRLELSFTGLWSEVTFWETIALAIISELYYRAVYKEIPLHELDIVFARMKDKIYSKLDRLRGHPNIKFALFGLRRRNSFLWEKWVTKLCKEMMGEQFTGTANAWMAFHYDLMPIGTNAHELPMVLTALADSEDEMRYAQYRVLELWKEMYGHGLQIFLPDTYGTEQFLQNAPAWVATFKGMRQDSGDTFKEGNLYHRFLEKHNTDSRNKLFIASDGLDVNPMIEIEEYFRGVFVNTNGWGTMATNDVEGCHTGNRKLRPFSVVCKVVDVNGRPCVKLSNNPNKNTGPRDEVERYKKIFGSKGWTSQVVRV